MSIHTLEIKRAISPDLSDRELSECFSSFGFPANHIRKFMNTSVPGKAATYYELDLFDELGHHGLKKITIQRIMLEHSYKPDYFLILVFNPLLNATGFECLYVPSVENNQRLIQEFRDVIHSSFSCDEAFADLRNWDANRVDYTHDFIFATEEEANLFYGLAHKTSNYRKREEKKIKSVKKFNQSASERNKSMKVMTYKKSEEIKANRCGLPEESIKFMATRLKKRMRFEVQCYKNKVRSIMNKHGFSRNIMNFLNEDLAHEILRTAYEEAIGAGDFYYSYSAEKKLGLEKLRQSQKRKNGRSLNEKIYGLMRLIAQARSLSKGKQQFIEGGHNIKHTDTVVEGCESTFRKYLERLKEMNMHPVMIPKDWARDYGIYQLHNPINELEGDSE